MFQKRLKKCVRELFFRKHFATCKPRAFDKRIVGENVSKSNFSSSNNFSEFEIIRRPQKEHDFKGIPLKNHDFFVSPGKLFSERMFFKNDFQSSNPIRLKRKLFFQKTIFGFKTTFGFHLPARLKK